MKLLAQWYGGPNYSQPYPEDAEAFDSIAAALRTYDAPRSGDPYYPCVESSEMWLYFGQEPLGGDAYPDRIVKEGPRGGIVVERC